MFRKKATHFYRHVPKGNLYASFVALFSCPSLSFILVQFAVHVPTLLVCRIECANTFKLYSTSAFIEWKKEKKEQNEERNAKLEDEHIQRILLKQSACSLSKRAKCHFCVSVCVVHCMSADLLGIFLPCLATSFFVLFSLFSPNFSSHAKRST